MDKLRRPPEDLPPLVAAAQWVSRMTTVLLEMAIPAAVGLWVDRLLGTRFVFALMGFGIGMVLGVWHLLQMASQSDRRQSGEQGDATRGRDQE